METIPKRDCQKIGFIRKTHGVHGELVLEFETDFEESVDGANRFFIEIDGLLVPFFVTENGLHLKTGKTAFVTLEWVNDEKYARRLVGKAVYLFLHEITDVQTEQTSSMYKGYHLADKTNGKVGPILNMEDFAGNLVMTVRYKGNEILVPYNNELLVSVDKKQKILTLNLPEGLIEINQ